MSPLKDKTVNSGSVTEAYAENATRITEQIAMEQKQCGFTAPSTLTDSSSAPAVSSSAAAVSSASSQADMD